MAEVGSLSAAAQAGVRQCAQEGAADAQDVERPQMVRRMKTVVLIGDSIRMGYENTVRQTLRGLAEVRSPEDNGGDSNKVLCHLGEWATALRPHVVHVNCGLHDLKTEFGQTRRAVPLDQYRRNVKRILSLLKAETDAVVLWASTTPVNETLHHRNKPFDRFERDVTAYNSAAAKVAGELDVPINDLYSCIDRIGPDRYLTPDGVHFTQEGYDLLGAAVAGFIKPYLQGAQLSHADGRGQSVSGRPGVDEG